MEHYKYLCRYESKNHSDAPTAVFFFFFNSYALPKVSVKVLDLNEEMNIAS